MRHIETKCRRPKLRSTLLTQMTPVSFGTVILLGSAVVNAQTTSSETDAVMEEIVVKGQIQQGFLKSLDVKRNNTVVSDALFGAELGELPDLSIAESLERITGVTSDRFKGGSSELSIRGLGAFLASSTFNGREITSGSDGRNVNFGQFPSELIGGTIVYKSQQASFVEGGVSGIVELRSLRPLDFGKRRIQVQGLFGYSDAESRVDGGEDISQRYTASYVDQWDDTGVGSIGIALGGQYRDDTAPEDFFTTSSSYRPCNTISNGSGGNCRFDADSDNPFYLVSNQYIYRAMKTDADRDSFFANFQWQPNENWDINFDYQMSDRSDIEERANLVLADGRRRITPVDISPSGALLAFRGETRVENQTVYRVRDELFKSYGLAVDWTNGNLSIDTDISYNKTERRQDELDMRIRRNQRVNYTFDRRGSNVPNWEIDADQAFNLLDHDEYDNAARARRRLENNDDEIFAIRVDADYAVDGNFFTNLKTGVRYSSRERIGDDGIDCDTSRSSASCTDFNLVDEGYASTGAIAARRDNFLVDDLFEGADTNFALTEWATWDAQELFTALTGSRDAGLFDAGASTLSANDTNITEDIMAIYAQADFATELFGLPASGNFGLRVVQTDVESVGLTSDITTTETIVDGIANGDLTISTAGGARAGIETNSFTNLLPSANINFDLNENMQLRFALYRGIARPDARQMTAALTIDTKDDFDPNTDTIAGLITTQGNPQLEPLESWNIDTSWEWYASDSTSLSIAAYYKRLETGLENTTEQVTLNVNGTPTTYDVIRQGNSDDSSTLKGIEFTGQHVFTSLPSPFNGLGVQLGINIANSDFETVDPTAVDRENPLANFVPAANINGYSKTSFNSSLFWENDVFSMRLAYKQRSEYLKSFRVGANRYTAEQGFLDFSASYDVTDNWQVRLQGLNLLDEPNVFNRPVSDNVAEANYSGTRFFVGVRAKF